MGSVIREQEGKAMNEPQLIDIASISEGAMVEAFGIKLAEAMANIADPNTPATAKRSITLTLTLHSKEDRTQIDTQFTCKASLASIIPSTSRIYMGRDEDGNFYALDKDPRQQRLFDPPKPKEAPEPLTFKSST
jgi:hypothetical protein